MERLFWFFRLLILSFLSMELTFDLYGSYIVIIHFL